MVNNEAQVMACPIALENAKEHQIPLLENWAFGFETSLATKKQLDDKTD